MQLKLQSAFRSPLLVILLLLVPGLLLATSKAGPAQGYTPSQPSQLAEGETSVLIEASPVFPVTDLADLDRSGAVQELLMRVNAVVESYDNPQDVSVQELSDFLNRLYDQVNLDSDSDTKYEVRIIDGELKLVCFSTKAFAVDDPSFRSAVILKLTVSTVVN